MAEEKKKKGFWSWLGFGKKEAEETLDTPTETPEEAPEQAVEFEAEFAPSQTQAESVETVTELTETQEALTTETAPEQAVEFETEFAPSQTQAESVETVTELAETQEALTTETAPVQAVEFEAESAPSETQAESVETTTELADTQDVLAIETAPEQAVEFEEEFAPNQTQAESVETVTELTDTQEALTTETAPAQAVEFEEEFAPSQTQVESVEAQEEATEEAITETAGGESYPEKPSEGGFFSRLIKGLIKTKQSIGSGFLGFFRGKKIDDELFEELEEQLLVADLGMPTTTKIINNLTQHASKKQLQDAELLYQQLKVELGEVLKPVAKPLIIEEKKPYVILMVGVNGVGKTTTIGKLARKFQGEGKSVMLAAGDTFRAAAVEQLQVWGERNQIPVVAQATGADSASVIFDAMQSAAAKGVDVLIADTAGRLQNKNNLMDELKKIVRVMKKYDETAPHEIMLTLDAGTGQNAISQAKLFNEAVGLTGITLTKLDGTAKGGVIFAIADQFNIPIRYIGVGEKIEDLRPFNAEEFIDALFAQENEKV
ncbi:signal recognition particle-docking protein FtsY [Pasteurellaceae bacterium Macca]|nr:signal recognition particle-docking protein FtsY [Pasteurellaceae bacterium Macca]